MYTLTLTSAALAALSLTAAIKVTSPDNNTVWKSGDSQTVSWEAVSTDATTFAIQLVNQGGFLQDSPVTLIANQSTGAANSVNSATVSFPSGSFPEGTAFQINLVSSSTSQNSAIYAQSQQFNITSGGSSSSSSSASSSSTSASSSTTSGAVPTTISQSGASSAVATVTSTDGSATSAGGNIPNASTTASAASSGELVSKPAGIAGLLLGAVGLITLFA
ncbi:hypothetical protein CI109_104824 [Kwoniella shandongensis]|uniref:Uncharacterized protein n=1 Tax=Kwoniella shandongensis TaxID=1734106 RepID=A0A5M6BRI0_9TREE|nr:uncharacterized protein CI109_006195 [Kwoniella shandongensis]KAA5525504.1 hypothetical protein CI109_006195 [Kwoniella shandongensis]